MVGRIGAASGAHDKVIMGPGKVTNHQTRRDMVVGKVSPRTGITKAALTDRKAQV